MEGHLVSQPARERVVFDWNNMAIGTVSGDHRDPKTNELLELVVSLNEEAKTRYGEGSVRIPANYIFGMRRDKVTLDRSFEEIRKFHNALAARQL